MQPTVVFRFLWCGPLPFTTAGTLHKKGSKKNSHFYVMCALKSDDVCGPRTMEPRAKGIRSHRPPRRHRLHSRRLRPYTIRCTHLPVRKGHLSLYWCGAAKSLCCPAETVSIRWKSARLLYTSPEVFPQGLRRDVWSQYQKKKKGKKREKVSTQNSYLHPCPMFLFYFFFFS